MDQESSKQNMEKGIFLVCDIFDLKKKCESFADFFFISQACSNDSRENVSLSPFLMKWQQAKQISMTCAMPAGGSDIFFLNVNTTSFFFGFVQWCVSMC